jgi:putative DNA primase/helicase
MIETISRVHNVSSTHRTASTPKPSPLTLPIRPPRPHPPEPLWEHFADELIRLHQWVCWIYSWRGGKWTKEPFQPDGRARASVTDPATWAPFEHVECAYHSPCSDDEVPFDGVGFVLSPNDPFCAFDFDHCRNATTGEIDPVIASYVRRLDSYSEISPSGSGVRVIVKGKLPERDRRIGNIEMYDSGRFVSITGHLLPRLVA